MSVHIRTEVRRIASVAGLIAAMTVGAAGVAQAQSAPSPAPAATPIGSPSGAGAQGTTPNAGANQSAPQPGPRARPAQPFNYMPSIDLVPTLTSPGIPNLLDPPQLRPFYQSLDLGGTVRFPITKQLSASFDRSVGGLIDQPLERYLNTNGTPGYSTVTRDVVLQYRLTDVINRYLSVELGHSFRHRLESGGVTGVNSGVSTNNTIQYNASSEHHFSYLAGTYTTKPIAGLLHAIFSFREAVDYQKIDHNVMTAACAPAASLNTHPLAGGGFSAPTCVGPGVLDENPGKSNWIQTTQSASMILPIDPKHGTSVVYGGTWGALNFYEAAPVPYRYAWLNTYQLNKKFNNTLSIALRHQDLHQTRQGTPLPTGVASGLTASNVVHPETWDIIGTIHLETKSLFGH